MSIAEDKNIQPLYWLRVIIQGAADAKVATLAPSPRVTKVIGIAQQSRVPEVVNSSSQLQERGLLIFGACLFI